MSQALRFESKDKTSFCTTKTQNNRLWFVNNPLLEMTILGFLAKYVQEHSVILYAFVMQGNHYHIEAKFPLLNRGDFFRDFNARIAQFTKFFVKEFEGGHLFGRRYSEQELPLELDVEDRFFYCALQAVNSGLCEFHHQYNAFNSFDDAIQGVVRKYRVVCYERYNQAKKRSANVDIEKYSTYYELQFTRLPGYENLSDEEYQEVISEKLEARRLKVITKRENEGKTSFLGVEALERTKPGALPKQSKTNARGEAIPLVLTCCIIAYENFYESYYARRSKHREASIKYRQGDSSAEFPVGTYKPAGPLVIK